jgi:hypothetical protein
MGSIKRVSLLATVALAALALTAASASAAIITPGGSAYSGNVAGVNSGPNPTLETSTATITCQTASTSGTMNGTALTGQLDFSWSNCSIVGVANCSVAAINDVDVIADESPAAPNFTIINDGSPNPRGETFISCATAFNCTASSDPDDGSGLTDRAGGTGSEVTANVAGGADPVVSIDDTVVVDGVGCPTEGQWVAQYTVTVPAAGLASNN